MIGPTLRVLGPPIRFNSGSALSAQSIETRLPSHRSAYSDVDMLSRLTMRADDAYWSARALALVCSLARSEKEPPLGSFAR